jgi:predicted trehalose synthase
MIGERIQAGDLDLLDGERLIEFVRPQRWFGSKSEELVAAHVLDASTLHRESPILVAALAEMRFQPGTHEVYQLLLGFRPIGEEWAEEVIGETDGFTAYDALADPELARGLVGLMEKGQTFQASEGLLEFRAVPGADFGKGTGEVRLLGVEQSNTSVVFGERLILKAYRRLEAGLNPELEMLRFLTERGFENIATLAGWYAYVGRPLNATLGILQDFVADAPDGWELALKALRSAPGSFPLLMRRLGEVTGTMHTALASDSSDPAFAPEEPSQEALPLLVATVDEEIEQVFLDLPELEVLDPVRGRGEEVRERLRLISHVGPTGRMIRHHGDYHLGQVLWADGDWVILDFEGEPARSLAERRRKRSPLRDVAGMLRSFAYAASASELDGGAPAPAGWESRAREEFLAGYFESVDRTLLPPTQEAIDRLLAVFELEKAVYELRYELNHRPDWLGIPVAGILRLLESE